MVNESHNFKLLVLDSSYTLEDINKRGLIESVTCRDLDGFFEHVYTVHPFSTLVTSENYTSKFGKPLYTKLNSKHTFIEGKVGKYKFLKSIFPLNFLLSQITIYYTLKKLIKKEKITFIRSGDMLYLGILSWLLSKSCKVPFLVRVGGNNDKVFETTGLPIMPNLFFKRSIEKKVERFVFPRAHLVAGANQDNLNFALNNGAKLENSTIWRYGNLLYEGHFINPNNRPSPNELFLKWGLVKKRFLIYIGRLEQVKKPDHVIEVLAFVNEYHKDYKLLMVGDGSMLEQLKIVAQELKVSDKIVFTGNQSQEVLSIILPHTGIVVSPHTGRALSEAALAKLPIVAYDIDWQGELIIDNSTGKLVTYNNLEELKKQTLFLIENPIDAERLALNLKNSADSMLDPIKLNEIEKSDYSKLFKKFYSTNYY